MNDKTAPASYTSLLVSEITQRATALQKRKLSSLYFGGGTPSVLPTEDILAIQRAIANAGFEMTDDAEVTIEINPGTVTKEKLDQYLALGVNRFSVGVQTFNSQQLKATGRLHSVSDSRELLQLLTTAKLNFSFDLLFGLPGQTKEDLRADLDTLLTYAPPHVSLYNLTVPKEHFMNQNRASDDIQAEMFDIIESTLMKIGVARYEISNFSKPGFESRHNRLYWTDQSYWGVGIGAHSYIREWGPFGTRFWNPAHVGGWAEQLATTSEQKIFLNSLPVNQVEPLKEHEALTDFCHTSLRLVSGLSIDRLAQKFSEKARNLTVKRLEGLLKKGLIESSAAGFSMTADSRPKANAIFLELTFLPSDFT